MIFHFAGVVAPVRLMCGGSAALIWTLCFLSVHAQAGAAQQGTQPGAAEGFNAQYERLHRGSSYSADVETGRVVSQRENAEGTSFPYFLQVPHSYDPQRRYPVRVFLHGGVSRGVWNPRSPEWWRSPERVQSEDYIGVFPASWGEERWWQSSQVENLREILGLVKATYNVDENQVSLIGVSDGGTGAYYVAFKDTTPWASFLPFIAHPAVLLNPRVGATGEVYRANLTNKPLFIVNGEVDRLYPTRSVEPFITDFSAAGVEMVFRPLEGVGHEVSWWPSEAAAIDAFIAARPRLPHPTCVSWETEDPDRGARAHWLVIDQLGVTPLDASFETSRLMDNGVPSGRADVSRSGNDVAISSERVARLTLLLSPDVFDFSEPIRVWWNGVLVHEGSVEPDPTVLSAWAERDRDRTMLYGAELALPAPVRGTPDPARLPPRPSSAECRGV